MTVYRLVIDPQQQQGQFIHLAPQQQHYLRGVVRLQRGDRFLALNGLGNSWLVEFKDEYGLILEEIAENRELPYPVTLMVALPKGNGFDQVVRCCTELGVTTLIPLISERTLLNPSPHKVERWRKIALEASEQAERQRIPQILDVMSLPEAFQTVNLSNSCGYFCVTRQATEHLLLYLQSHPPTPIILATGPEGGWTEEEVETAKAIGFRTVSLGSRILRAITAPIVALSLVSASLESVSDRSVLSC